MSYFFQNEYNTEIPTIDLQDKLHHLHEVLYSRIRNHNWDLHPRPQKSQIVCHQSVAAGDTGDTLTLMYLRAPEQAELVERLMGREDQQPTGAINVYRHPVIELRVSPQSFAIELILSPDAWWDQQNFIGKLDLERHRAHLRGILRKMGGDYRFGFWDGIHLGDMHLNTWQLLYRNHLDEWMATFCDGQDWLRVGVWYDLEDERLNEENVIAEVTDRVKDLYDLYTFLLWTSNNNFHRFYEKRQVAAVRRYA